MDLIIIFENNCSTNIIFRFLPLFFAYPHSLPSDGTLLGALPSSIFVAWATIFQKFWIDVKLKLVACISTISCIQNLCSGCTSRCKNVTWSAFRKINGFSKHQVFKDINTIYGKAHNHTIAIVLCCILSLGRGPDWLCCEPGWSCRCCGPGWSCRCCGPGW